MEPYIKLSAEKRKNITIETVIELAGQQNPSEITTAAIAKHMGVTQGALFRHYATKDDLWQAVMEWVSLRLLDRLDGAVKNTASPIESMKAMFLSHIEFVADHPGVPRMLFGELQRSAPTPAKRMAQTLIKNYKEQLCTVIEEGKKSGEISPSLDAEAAAVLFIGMVQGLVMQSLLSGDIGAMRAAGPSLFTIYQRGVAA